MCVAPEEKSDIRSYEQRQQKREASEVKSSIKDIRSIRIYEEHQKITTKSKDKSNIRRES